jgi:hypothetical protein
MVIHGYIAAGVTLAAAARLNRYVNILYAEPYRKRKFWPINGKNG